jgi:cystathionine beta-lyase/cystathionine gamma-synthase
MSTQGKRLSTQLVHAGEPQPRIAGAVTMPVFQSSTYEYGGAAGYDDLRYLRLNNSPNHVALHDKLATLEGTEAALVTASGMAAIYVTLLSQLRPGDHVVAQACLYGGTHDLLAGHLTELGVEFTSVAGDDAAAWRAAVRPNTRLVYCEALTNPRLDVADFSGIVALCREQGLVSVIDATFASPALFRPAQLGFDLVLHSATKYLNGHSDIVAGVVAGSAANVTRARKLLNLVGATLDAHACFLLHRGLKTLAVRLRQQCATAQTVAEFLVTHPAVAAVNYPGLPTHPGHARVRELFGGFGGMLSFELRGGAPAADAFLGKLQLLTNAPSLGGPESLVTLPAQTSHVGMAPDARRALGISDGLVRLSVGLEDARDLVDDLRQAL